MGVNLVFAYRRGLIRPVLSDWADIAKSVLAAALMGAAVWFAASRFAGMGKIAAVALPTLIGAAVYALLAIVLRSEEMKLILSRIRKN